MRTIAAFVLLLFCGAAFAIDVDSPVNESANPPDSPPPGVKLFDLHDPALMNDWPVFLATTPMLNDELLPPSLQSRLANVVTTYRLLTPVDRPAFFVATYFDVLSDRLLSDPGDTTEVLPMQVCPVFASGSDASVSSLLAVASGLSDELFVNAPGQAQRYRYLFLQTEFSHCRFLTDLRVVENPHPILYRGQQSGSAAINLSFNVGDFAFTATISNKEELRALVETVGEVDALATFRQQRSDGNAMYEAEVLTYIRLLSLLATDGKSGYAAIPVLLPLLSGNDGGVHSAGKEPLRIADALDVAYQAREEFRRLVAFPIREPDDLLTAKVAVMQALADGRVSPAIDERVTSLLGRFVTGSDLLLATTMAQESIAQ